MLREQILYVDIVEGRDHAQNSLGGNRRMTQRYKDIEELERGGFLRWNFSR